MSKYTKSSPGLFQEVGSIFGLYRTVFWMMGQRLQRGQNWEEELTRDALRVQTFDDQREPTPAGSPQHN